MFRIALITAALVAGAAHAQDLDALKADTRKNALPVLPKVVGMMQETVAAKGPVEAIPVGDVCLKCHGPADKLDAGLKAQLAKSYPHDSAFGYEKGQIRGALTVKRPL